MEDEQIVDLYLTRQERAIRETQKKYGSLISGVAGRMLLSREDREETENDVYLRVWNAIPPDEPRHFAAYLAKITRRLCVDRIRRASAAKRGGNEYVLSLDELEDCLPGGNDPAEGAQRSDLEDAVNRFLAQLTPTQRNLFLQRYFYAWSVAEIAKANDLTQNHVKVTLSRLRARLKLCLTKEEFI